MPTSNNIMKPSKDDTIRFLVKMIKGAGILAATRSLGEPKSITTNPELARQFCEYTEMEVELLEHLLRHGGTNHDDGVLSVVEKYALGKKALMIP